MRLRNFCRVVWQLLLKLPMEQEDNYVHGFLQDSKVKTNPNHRMHSNTLLATHNISLATVKVYLSAVRHMHLCRGLHDHFNQQTTPQLQLILKGIKRRQACISPISQCLPACNNPDALQNRTLTAEESPSYFNTTL